MISAFLLALIETNLLLYWLLLFAVLAVSAEFGFRIGRMRFIKETDATKEAERAGISTITASMFGLLAFTLGLTISFAQNRFEVRRDLVVLEANTIGTAWLRARLVGGPEGSAIASLIEDYTKVRRDFTTTEQEADVPALLARTSESQSRMWQLATDLARRAPTPITASLITALNDMFDASLSQRFTFASRLPMVFAWALMLGAVLAAGAMGYLLGTTGFRQMLLSGLSLLMWAGAVVLIADINRARLGSIRADAAPLIWTLEGFGPTPPSR